ncbi:MAG: hypothetical protein WAN75_08505, partial [Xanthobacteraceae bacterium]
IRTFATLDQVKESGMCCGGTQSRRRLGTLAWVATCLHEINKKRFACLKFGIRQPPKNAQSHPSAPSANNFFGHARVMN